MENIITTLCQCIIIFNPILKQQTIGLLFQNRIEYYAHSSIHGSNTIQKRDEFKQTICYQDGITLIVIPYWWNRSVESLAHSIYMARPDVPVSSYLTGDKIPTEIPKILRKFYKIKTSK